MSPSGRAGGARAALTAAALYGVLAFRSRAPVDAADRKAFTAVNQQEAQRWLWVPQQAGTPWLLPATAAVALVSGRRRLAVAAGLALPVEKGVEVATKRLTRRPRPAHVVRSTRLRDDAPTQGSSYPSGHTALAACLAVLLLPYVPTGAGVALVALAAGNAVARVHQGAHYPTDVVGGAALGVALGAGLPVLVSASAPLLAQVSGMNLRGVVCRAGLRVTLARPR